MSEVDDGPIDWVGMEAVYLRRIRRRIMLRAVIMGTIAGTAAGVITQLLLRG